MNANQLIEAIAAYDPKLAQTFANYDKAQSGKLGDALAEVTETASKLSTTETERDHYRAELNKLQAARGTHNRRKARRIALKMIAEGQV